MNLPIVALDARLIGQRSTGDSTYWAGLLQGLSEADSPLNFLLFSNGERPPGIPESPKMRWIRLDSRNSRWWSLVRFPLAARRFGAKAIHTQYNLSPLTGKRGITTVHDVSFFIGPQWFQPKDLFLLRRFVPASVKRASKVIAVSKTSQSEIESYIPAAKGKTTVAYNGPNPSITPIERDPAKQIVHKELGIDQPFLLTVGTRWPRKNMALAINASKLLPSEIPHKLVVTGKPGWGEEVNGDRLIPTGYVSDEQLSALYSAADIYLAPSLHEGFGIPVVEAFACGCPVMCSSGGALPEIAGDAAWVMENWAPNVWARAIADVLSDSGKLDAMRERGNRRAAEFTWKRSAEVHANVYQEVADL